MTVRAFDRALWLLVACAIAAALWLLPSSPPRSAAANAMVEVLGLDSGAPLRILTLERSDAPLAPFAGSRVPNVLHAAASLSALEASMREPGWDVVAVLQDRPLRDPAIFAAFERLDYVVVVDDARYLVALPRQRVRLEPLPDAGALQWQPWSEPDGVALEAVDGHPRIRSDGLVDAGFMTPEHLFEGPLLVEAGFDGQVDGPDDHAAHLSFLSKTPLLLLKAGVYEPGQPLRAVSAGVDGAARLVFGLGGWARGRGDLALTSLKVSRLVVTPVDATRIASATLGKGRYAAPLVFALATAVLLCCALAGRHLLRRLGFEQLSLLGYRRCCWRASPPSRCWLSAARWRWAAMRMPGSRRPCCCGSRWSRLPQQAFRSSSRNGGACSWAP